MIEITIEILFAIAVSFAIAAFWFMIVDDDYLPLVIKICFTVAFACLALLSWLPLLSCFIGD